MLRLSTDGLRLAALLLVLLITVPADAQFLYKRIDLPYLAERAATIVQGRVVEVRYEGHPDYPNVSTVFVTLEVERMLRGDAVERFSFRQYLAGPAARTGKREYAVGQRLLLFMTRESDYGLSAPMAREQGRFSILRDRQGNEMVANGYGNAGLFRNVSETAGKAGMTLTPAQLRIARAERGPVPLEDFVELVRRLSSQAGTQ
ncbi:MAG: hypothetical protein HYS33_08105 [Acidobacteria bacterium]|nr:hypothetical protein [Acidobacteriota bacterium]